MNRFSRREFLTLAGVSALAATTGWQGFAQPGRAHGGDTPPPRPNVLFIAVDDLRPQLNCYGHSQILSPHLDRLAAEGMLFSRAYCQMAICGPTRASLLTGLRPQSTGIFDLNTKVSSVLPDVVTLPMLFQRNGYTTERIGKVYHHADDDARSWSQMHTIPAQEYITQENKELIAKLSAEADSLNLKDAQPGMSRWLHLRGPATECAPSADTEYIDGKIAALAVERLKAQRDTPFFLAVGFHKPHLPFNCPEQYWSLYDPARINLADNPFKPQGAPSLALHKWEELRAYQDIPKKGDLDDATARRLIHGYYACVSYVDAQIGRVLEALRIQGLDKNTIVVVWGDHGWNLGEHGLWCKHSNFETSVHAPLLVRAPGLGQGRTNALVEFVDIYPSLAQMCGLQQPAGLEGTSFLPLFNNPAQSWKEQAFSQYPRGMSMGYSMRTDRYRYTEWRKPGNTDGALVATELYDHQTDPQENVNLAEHAGQKELLTSLHQQLTANWKRAHFPSRRKASSQ